MKRPLAVIGFTCLVSLTFFSFIPNKILPYIIGLFAILSATSLIIKKIRETKIFPIVFLVCLISSLIYLINTQDIAKIQKLDNTEPVVSGIIHSVPYKHDNTYEYIIRADKIDNVKTKPFYINLKSTQALEGDIYCRFNGKIRLYVPPKFPSFDSEKYYRSKSIYILGSLYGDKNYQIQKPDYIDWYYYILNIRKAILSLPKQIYPNKIANIINGFLMGEKNSFPKDTAANFDRLGVYHLLATSGVHVAILSQFLLWILKKLKMKKNVAEITSAVFVFLFMAIIGFTPSVTRAGIMCIIYLLGLAILKTADPLNSLGISVLIICAIKPNSAYDIGLWLSFLSTLGIILAYKPINNFLQEKLNRIKNKLLKYIFSGISVGLATYAFTAPLSIFIFKKISLISPLSNLIFIPCINILLNLSAIINIFEFINIPNIIFSPIIVLCGWIVTFIDNVSSILAKIPYVLIPLNYGVTYIWIIGTLILVAICIQGKNLRHLSFTATLLSINLALISVFSYQIANYNHLNISVVPCNEGVDIIMSKNAHRAVILCINENSNTKFIEQNLSETYTQNMDYLNLCVNGNPNKNKIKNIIKKFAPSTAVISDENKTYLEENNNRLKDEFPKTNFNFYEHNHISSFQDDLSITNLQINNHYYIKIQYRSLNIIIFPGNGNTDDLPQDWKDCDFAIIQGLPINYQKVKYKNIILTSGLKSYAIHVNKLIDINQNIFSVYRQGPIYINVDPKENYKIRRFQ